MVGFKAPAGQGTGAGSQKLGNTLPDLLCLFLQVNTGPCRLCGRLLQVAEIGQKDRPFQRDQKNTGTPGETTQIAAILRGSNNKPVQFLFSQQLPEPPQPAFSFFSRNTYFFTLRQSLPHGMNGRGACSLAITSKKAGNPRPFAGMPRHV